MKNWFRSYTSKFIKEKINIEYLFSAILSEVLRFIFYVLSFSTKFRVSGPIPVDTTNAARVLPTTISPVVLKFQLVACELPIILTPILQFQFIMVSKRALNDLSHEKLKLLSYILNLLNDVLRFFFWLHALKHQIFQTLQKERKKSLEPVKLHLEKITNRLYNCLRYNNNFFSNNVW